MSLSDREEVESERMSQRRALPVFNGKTASFPIWKARVRAWLQAATPSLLYVLEESSSVSDAHETQSQSSSSSSEASVPGGKEKKKKNEKQIEGDRLKVYNLLISALDDTHVGMIVTEVAEGDALGAWKILLRKYERNTLASRNQLRRELHSLKLKIDESIDEYKARAMHIVSRLKSAKEIVGDGEILYCLLSGLPESYEVVKQAMEVQDIVDIEEACGHLREVEDRLSRVTDSSKSSNNNVSSEKKGVDLLNRISYESKKCMVCDRPGHTAFKCWYRCEEGCYRCGGDHCVKDCDEEFQKSDETESRSRSRRRDQGSERKERYPTPAR